MTKNLMELVLEQIKRAESQVQERNIISNKSSPNPL